MAGFNGKYYKYVEYFTFIDDGIRGFISEVSYLNIV